MVNDFRRRYRELGARGFARWILVKRIGKGTFRRIDRLMARSSLVGDPAVFDPGCFSWVADLEAATPRIRAELDELLAYRAHLPPLQQIQPDQGKISPDELWKAFVLCGYDYRSERNCRRCPQTAAVLASIPGLRSAWFSILAPGKHIPRHAGVTKAVVRCHLGLVVPRDGRCEMQVGEERLSWQEGRCVVFDDQTKHEVWNETDQERVVLIVDVDRPMRWPGRAAARLVFFLLRWSPFLRDARRNEEAWQDQVEGVLPAELETPAPLSG